MGIDGVIVVAALSILAAVLILQGIRLLRRGISLSGKPTISFWSYFLGKSSIIVVAAAAGMQGIGTELRVFQLNSFVAAASAILLAIGAVITIIGVAGLGESLRMGIPQERVNLRTKGIYSISRNPIYLGLYVMAAAAVIYTMNPVVLAFGIVLIGIHHKIIPSEEEFLREKFGEGYIRYCRRVGRYI